MTVYITFFRNCQNKILFSFKVNFAHKCKGPHFSEDWRQLAHPQALKPWVCFHLLTLKATGINPMDQVKCVCIETSPKQVARFKFALQKAAQPSEQIPLPIPVSNLLLQTCWPISHLQGLLVYVFSNPDNGLMQIGRYLAKVGQAVSLLWIKRHNRRCTQIRQQAHFPHSLLLTTAHTPFNVSFVADV